VSDGLAALRFEALDGRVRRAVESVAATDPNPSDPFRGLYVSDDLALSLARTGSPEALDARLHAAAERLGLDLLDAAVLALCAAPELDPRYGRLYAYLQDDVTRKLASPRLVGSLLAGEGVSPADVLTCFETDGPLRRLGALRLLDQGSGPTPLAERGAKVAERLAAFLLTGEIDAHRDGDGRLRVVAPPPYDPGRTPVVADLRALLGAPSHIPIVLAGPDAAALLAVALGQPVLLAPVTDALDGDAVRDAALAAALAEARLVFDGLERLEPVERTRAVRALHARTERVLLIAGTSGASTALGDAVAFALDAPMPTFAERSDAWAALAGTDDTGDAPAKFRLSLGQIAEAAEIARIAATTRGAETPTPDDLDYGARRASASRLGDLAARLEPGFTWDDLVLPEKQKEVLGSISAYLRHRDLVLSGWGYERAVAQNQGLKVLFAGESGTGKTMASRVLARVLGLEIFRLDLATVVSKYIGETEKNLDRVFEAAHGSNAILFFDEADALFGKRSEVKDAHDRYANIEVAYLLQKMETYPGAVILATNYRHNIDQAFLRRLDFVIDFPFPEPEDRERIWRLLLPTEAPLASDVDVAFLAQQFKLSGGSIRNASLAAAFLAAEDGGEIGMRHLVRGVALEYQKLGRLTIEADFEQFHELIR
jgi:hypothetical protein